jgi:ADP-heptose:LPS heptosyltransferase
MSKNALILRALGLGDFLTAIPALRLIRLALPSHSLVLAGPPHLGRLAQDAGLVDDLIEARDLSVLPATPAIDVAIDLHGNGPESRQLLMARKPRRLVAYTTTGFADWEFSALEQAAGHRTPVWDPDEHEVSRWCRLIAESFGIDARSGGGVAGSLPIPPLPTALPSRAIVVHPGASAMSRQWPPQRYAQVARALGGLGHPVVVTGGAAERLLVEGVADHSGATACLDPGIRDLFAMVANAALVVSGDTGVAHVASTYCCPSVVLFGPVPPAQWGPPPSRIHRALHLPLTGRARGDPHGLRVDPALLRIDVETVLAACSDVLAAAAEQCP